MINSVEIWMLFFAMTIMTAAGGRSDWYLNPDEVSPVTIVLSKLHKVKSVPPSPYENLGATVHSCWQFTEPAPDVCSRIHLALLRFPDQDIEWALSLDFPHFCIFGRSKVANGLDDQAFRTAALQQIPAVAKFLERELHLEHSPSLGVDVPKPPMPPPADDYRDPGRVAHPFHASTGTGHYIKLGAPFFAEPQLRSEGRQASATTSL